MRLDLTDEQLQQLSEKRSIRVKDIEDIVGDNYEIYTDTVQVQIPKNCREFYLSDLIESGVYTKEQLEAHLREKYNDIISSIGDNVQVTVTDEYDCSYVSVYDIEYSTRKETKQEIIDRLYIQVKSEVNRFKTLKYEEMKMLKSLENPETLELTIKALKALGIKEI